MWFIRFLVLSSIFTQSAAKCTASRVKIAFVIDSSGSVTGVEDNFQRQIQIAKSVLSAVRDMFSEAGADELLEWGAIEFGTQAKVVHPMHVSTGNSDNMDENMKVQCEGNYNLTENWRAYCGTSYERSLDAAIHMLGDVNDTSLFIWFLSDGLPGDVTFQTKNATDPAKLKAFREKKLNAKKIRTVCSFLAPLNATFVPLANSTMRALCDHDVLVDVLGDTFNASAYTEKAGKMFSDAVKTYAFVCEPALWITVAIIIAAIIGALCCCCAGVKAKQLWEEEGTEMTQVYAPSNPNPKAARATPAVETAPPTQARVGKRPRVENHKRRRRSTQNVEMRR